MNGKKKFYFPTSSIVSIELDKVTSKKAINPWYFFNLFLEKLYLLFKFKSF
jgi:hypothetical protein